MHFLYGKQTRAATDLRKDIMKECSSRAQTRHLSDCGPEVQGSLAKRKKDPSASSNAQISNGSAVQNNAAL